MIDTPPDPDSRPVLGLFANEAELRDHLAARLELIEPGLTLIKTEYVLDNPVGSGGRIDILARDSFDHVVCIEIKRSDRSARETLNELSKYLTLLVERDRVPREMIRCMVVSTHWQELLLPLSYFALSSGVDVTGWRAAVEDDALRLRREALRELRFLPQLSPDMDFIWFEDEAPRRRYIESIKSRSAKLPFVRMALLQLEPIPSNRTERPPYPMVICVWRVPDGLHERVEAVTGKPIGADFPYAAPGWEAESDAKDWISDVSHEELPQVAHGWQHGTPEMLQSMVANYRLCAVERVGDWPKLEFINDDERILSAALAGSPLGGTERPNRNSYRATVTPAVAPSWKMGVEGFLRFIAFEPAWGSAAAGYLATSRHTFERSMAIRNVAPAAVLAVLNPDPLFDLLGEPRPAGDAGVLDRMAREELIVSDLQGGYDVTNLAVLALARDLAPVPALARKAVRIVRYRGTDKLETLEEHAAPVGYVGGFQAILRSLLAMVPSHEEVVGGVRRSIPMIPELALREVLANALVHQDLTTMGAGPLIEVYTDRIEVTNPGEPLVEPDRLLDAPPRSRNEALASLMRRLGICEERGSGIDKIVASIERLSLPPPLFRGAAGSTVVTLFAERPFQRMSQDERIRACYQHACLHYAAADPMSNTSLRERLGLGQGQHPQASLVIRAAIEAGRIKPLAEDQARRNARYIPFWA